jgi:hypothetical protein
MPLLVEAPVIALSHIDFLATALVLFAHVGINASLLRHEVYPGEQQKVGICRLEIILNLIANGFKFALIGLSKGLV